MEIKDNVYNEPIHVHPGPPPPYDSPSANPTGSALPVSSPVVIVQPTVASGVIIRQLGVDPTVIFCPSCRNQILTRVTCSPTFRTHCCALALFLTGFWPCVWLPYCTPACRNNDHYCPHCNAYLGRVQI